MITNVLHTELQTFTPQNCVGFILNSYWMWSENQSLANKYRPKSFDEIIGQEHVIDILQAKIIKNDTKGHNYIFCGPRGTGKTSTARLFAKAMNATIKDEKWNPSPNDVNAQAIDQGLTLDYIEIDAASHTGVENIRETILDKVAYPPTQLKKKVYVIDEVHMLSTSAFNALLKTIEEPREYMVFILATTEIHKVPDTILSRCQVFNFKKVPDQSIIDHLTSIANKEWFAYGDEALRLIASISDGCVRDAVKYLDQVSILGTIDATHVSKFLGIASEKSIKDFLDKIEQGEREEIFTAIDAIHNAGIDLYNFAKQLLQYMDKHLMENIDIYLNISQSCSEILRTIKYYPYPVIVYKIVLNKLVQNNKTISSIEREKKSDIQRKKDDPKIKNDSKEKNESIKNIPITLAREEDATTENTENNWINNNIIAIDNEDLKKNLLENIDKIWLRDNLADNIIITSIEDNIVHMVTISNIANMLLQKSDTIQYLEKILSNICQKTMMLSIKFMKKEDFLSTMVQ